MPSLGFEAYGVAGVVETDDQELWPQLSSALPPGWRRTPARAASACFAVSADRGVTVDGVTLAGPQEDEEATIVALRALIRRYVAEHSPALLFIHAGVVVIDGTGIVIPGASHSGKTTLVSQLVADGAVYFSDEYAVVDAQGFVHPYPKPLSVRLTDQTRVAVPVAEERIATDRIRPGLVVLTAYRPGAEWRPRTGSAGEGAFGLVEHVVPFRRRARAAMAVCATIASHAHVIVSERGDAPEVSAHLRSLLKKKTWHAAPLSR